MKTLFNQTKKILAIGMVLLFAGCAAEDKVDIDPILKPTDPIVNEPPHNLEPPDNPEENNTDNSTNLYFGFLDGESSSTGTYIDMPIESSATNLLIGRWRITKLGADEYNDGNIKFYYYENFNHKDCRLSFLQWNTNGVVFENSYYKENGVCNLYSEIDVWELIEPNRFKIWVYDNIYLIKVTQSELILKYDWRFENSLYGPLQVYYYYERIQAPK